MRTRQSAFFPRTVGLVVVLLAALACVGVTSAGVPGRWDALAEGANYPGNSANELGLARTADGVLHVALKQRIRPALRGHRPLTVSAAGRVGSASTIVSGWVNLSDPELVADPVAGCASTSAASGRRSRESRWPGC